VLVAATVTASAQDAAPAPGDAPSAHQHHVRVAHQQALDQAAAHQAAFAVGGAAVLGSMLADGVDELDGGGSLGDGAVAEADDAMNMLEEMVDMLRKISKIIVKYARLRSCARCDNVADPHLPRRRSFYQICSTFLKSLDVPWPRARLAPHARWGAAATDAPRAAAPRRRCVRRHHGARQRRQPQPGAAAQDGCAAAGAQLAGTARLR
jgi:hypothetical protein